MTVVTTPETVHQICDACAEATGTFRNGRFGKFLHVRCFDAWWRSEYGETRGVYYSWMRGGMCVR